MGQQRASGRRSARRGREPASSAKSTKSSRASATGSGTSAAMLLADRPLSIDAVRELQHDAGNRAVTLALQRQVAVQRQLGPTDPKYHKGNRPKHGADVRAALRTHLPGLLAGLTEAQIAHWQKVVDYYAVTRHINREQGELYNWYSSRYPGLPLAGIGPYTDALQRLEKAKPKFPEGGEKVTVDPNLLLADDVKAEPEWDVNAEMAFRQWAVAELAKDPPEFDMFPEHDDEIITRRTSLGSYTTKGIITLSDLKSRFRTQYEQMVVNRPEWHQLFKAFYETEQVYDEATRLHKERSEINARNRGVFGIDIIRNIIEVIGEGDEDYPAMAQWERPKALLARVGPLLEGHKFELAVPLLAMAEMETAQAADRIFKYDHRIESGAALGVKWLSRVKAVGSVAASIAAGPLGITGSALVAGGYTLVQEGAQNVSAMAHGQRDDLGLGDVLKKAGVATVAGLMGGALQSRFQSAIAARLAQATGSAGGAIRGAAVSSAAAMTSSVYNTAAETVLQNVIEGKPLPKDATEFADMIVNNAIQAGAMDVALRGPSARVAREYQAWKGGRARPVVPVAGETEPAGARTTPAAPDPKLMPEDVVRRMFDEAGSWERLKTELNTGTGLGHGLTVQERRAMLDRFDASREQLAREVGNLFGGSVAVTDGGVGRQIEVQFLGEGGAQHIADARGYLDTKRPGWEAETGLALKSTPAATDGKGALKSAQAAKALERATPAARRVAARLAPLYDTWTGRSGEERLGLLIEIVNQDLRAAGAPEVHPAFLGKGGSDDGALVQGLWEIQINAKLLKGAQTPEQFAFVCGIVMHEGHHALQVFRAARTNPVVAQQRADAGRLAPEVAKAALDANMGRRPAEKFGPTSLAYAEAAAVRESLWGAGRPKRDAVYARLEIADVALTKAKRNMDMVKDDPPGSPMRAAAERDLLAARTERDRAHDDYMALPEEVEAWRIGRETQAAVQERLVVQALARARIAERRAHAKYVATESVYLARVTDPKRPPTAVAERAWEQALQEHQRALDEVQRLERRRDEIVSVGRTP